MNDSQRIKEVEKYAGLSTRALALEVGLKTPQTLYDIHNGKHGISKDVARAITAKYLNINPDWLLLGVGDMLKQLQMQTACAPDVFTAPLLPLAAQGGTLNDFVMSVKVAECERVVTPIRDVDFVMTVTGDSMAPDYPNGAQVLIKKVDETAFIEWGRVYVLDTCNGSVIKEVRKGGDGDSVQCYSLNPDPKYQPFAVRFTDIYGMYRVLMCMSLK